MGVKNAIFSDFGRDIWWAANYIEAVERERKAVSRRAVDQIYPGTVRGRQVGGSVTTPQLDLRPRRIRGPDLSGIILDIRRWCKVFCARSAFESSDDRVLASADLLFRRSPQPAAASTRRTPFFPFPAVPKCRPNAPKAGKCKKIAPSGLTNRSLGCLLSTAPSGRIAQSVEQGTENPRVPGSIPGPATIFCARIPRRR